MKEWALMTPPLQLKVTSASSLFSRSTVILAIKVEVAMSILCEAYKDNSFMRLNSHAINGHPTCRLKVLRFETKGAQGRLVELCVGIGFFGVLLTLTNLSVATHR